MKTGTQEKLPKQGPIWDLLEGLTCAKCETVVKNHLSEDLGRDGTPFGRASRILPEMWLPRGGPFLEPNMDPKICFGRVPKWHPP